MPGYFFMGQAVTLCGASVASHSCTLVFHIRGKGHKS
jgi:hypothetical protein